MIPLLVATAVCLLLVVQFAHLVLVMRWTDRQTRGLGYYGRPRRARTALKRCLRIHALLLKPFLSLISRLPRPSFNQGSFTYRGTAAPRGSCDPATFERAERYRPQPEDVFVVSQMRSGTTWMQHLVYQVLTRGEGDLSADDITLNAVSPWLESFRTVAVNEAPLIGPSRPTRLIKTHLSVELCPLGSEARYICVVRHPLACFASSVDFVRNNLQGFEPTLEEFEAWFCTREWMWWDPWPDHVAGWWRRAQSDANVLLVRYEDMLDDLSAVARQVAALVQVEPLDRQELEAVLHKCSFAYMKQHGDAFEMHPPHILQAGNRFFVSGRKERAAQIPADMRQRIAEFCRRRCEELAFPLGSLYPDLAPPPAGGLQSELSYKVVLHDDAHDRAAV